MQSVLEFVYIVVGCTPLLGLSLLFELCQKDNGEFG